MRDVDWKKQNSRLTRQDSVFLPSSSDLGSKLAEAGEEEAKKKENRKSRSSTGSVMRRFSSSGGGGNAPKTVEEALQRAEKLKVQAKGNNSRALRSAIAAYDLAIELGKAQGAEQSGTENPLLMVDVQLARAQVLTKLVSLTVGRLAN